MRWKHPALVSMMPEYIGYDIAPESNANYAFIISGLNKINGKAAYLLPCGVLSSSNKTEDTIKKELIEDNLVSAVITLPDKMFEATSIPTCIILFDKRKKSLNVEMIDLRQEYVEKQREQNGQYGGSSHTNRTYTKTIKVITEEANEKALRAIANAENIDGFSRSVPLEEIRKQDYSLVPSKYIELPEMEVKHRSFEDIAADYNRIVKAKNAVQITFNETAARRLGIPIELYKSQENTTLADPFGCVGQKCEKENNVHFTKSDGIQIKCSTKTDIPILICDFIRDWTQYERYLNNEQNRLLAEFRDALLPELMSGKIEITSSQT